MGYSLSWVAVRGKPTATIYDQLAVRGTGTREEIQESPIVGAKLPDGWSLVVTDHDFRLMSDSVLESLSSNCELVACAVEEHVMHSIATGWKDGRKVWSASHDAQQAVDHLEADGNLPPTFASLRDRACANQQAVEERERCDTLFDVPVELAKSLTGYRHDEDVGIHQHEEGPFEILVSTAPPTSTSAFREAARWACFVTVLLLLAIIVFGVPIALLSWLIRKLMGHP